MKDCASLISDSSRARATQISNREIQWPRLPCPSYQLHFSHMQRTPGMVAAGAADAGAAAAVDVIVLNANYKRIVGVNPTRNIGTMHHGLYLIFRISEYHHCCRHTFLCACDGGYARTLPRWRMVPPHPGNTRPST